MNTYSSAKPRHGLQPASMKSTAENSRAPCTLRLPKVRLPQSESKCSEAVKICEFIFPCELLYYFYTCNTNVHACLINNIGFYFFNCQIVKRLTITLFIIERNSLLSSKNVGVKFGEFTLGSPTKSV